MASLAPASLIAHRFTVVAPLPDRGLGESYHCTDPSRANGPVLVKLLRPAGPALPPPLAELLGRARLARHDGILRVLDQGVWNDRPFVVYEYFEGSSLGDGLDRARAEGTPLPLDLLREVFTGVAAALDFAHTKAPKSVLHLGVDPSCVILRRLPRKPIKLKVLDFGLAPWAELDPAVPAASARRLRCAPPEAYGGDPSPRSDVFALGVLLRELLTAAPDPAGGAARWRDDVPEALRASVMRASDPSPALRYESVAAFTDDALLAWAQPVKVAPAAPEPEPAAAAPHPTGPSLDPLAAPAVAPAAPAAWSPPVAGTLPQLARSDRSVDETISLVNIASRRAPSPWDLGALRDERAEAEEQAAAAWFRPRVQDVDETFVQRPPAARRGIGAPAPVDEGADTTFAVRPPASPGVAAPRTELPRHDSEDVGATIVMPPPTHAWPQGPAPSPQPPVAPVAAPPAQRASPVPRALLAVAALAALAVAVAVVWELTT